MMPMDEYRQVGAARANVRGYLHHCTSAGSARLFPGASGQRIARAAALAFSFLKEPAWSLSACRQSLPGGKRVHVVSPMRDLPVLKLNNRTEPIFVLCTGRENRPVHFVFDHDDAATIRRVGDQLVCGQ